MAINKVVYGNNTLIDITDTTATAEDVASGKIFYLKDGTQATGTASGGGGDSEYEEGIYEPTSDIARPTINFSKTHSVPPTYISIYDTTASVQPSNSVVGMNYIDEYRLFTDGYYYSSSAKRYGTIQYIYRGTSTTSLSTGTVHFTYNSDNTKSSSSSYARYWVDTSSFRPYSNSTSRYFRSGRTYKWFAIWI